MMLPIGPFSVIYADPPWPFRSWSDKGRNRCPDALVRQKGLAERHYQVMWIEDLRELPVESIALPDSALFMWVVSSHLDQALDLGKRWGFTYKAIVFNWVKLYPKSGDLCFGLGKWTRLGSEQCLLFTRGAPKRQSASVPQVIIAPRGAHSVKPVEAYERIEALMGDVSRVELFARNRREGWDAWGDQLDQAVPAPHAPRHADGGDVAQRELF